MDSDLADTVAILREVKKVLLHFVDTSPDAWAPIVSTVSDVLFIFSRYVE